MEFTNENRQNTNFITSILVSYDALVLGAKVNKDTGLHMPWEHI